jgi:hypothetical protein
MAGINWEKRLAPWLTGKTKNGGKESVGYCPLCEDPETSSTPSASFDFSHKRYACFKKCEGAPRGGLGLPWLWKVMQDKGLVSNVSSIRQDSNESSGLPSEEKVSQWVTRLLNNERALTRLQEQRGLSAATIQEYEIGWDNDRYTIPIYDRDDNLVNVRKYKLGAKVSKMVNIDGHGGATLYGVDALDRDEVLLTEGEMDKLIAREKGFYSITSTAGVLTWRHEWSMLFKGKRVYIVYDCDDPGIAGAKKVAVSLTRAGAEAYIVLLPLSTKGADLTDYFVNQGYTAKSLRQLMADTPIFEGATRPVSGRVAEPVEVTLPESFSSQYTDKPIQVTVTIIGKENPPYALPEQVALTCDQDWSKCSKCPMSLLHNGSHEFKVDRHSELILKLVDKPKDQRDKSVLEDVGVPGNCPRVEVQVLKKYTVEKLFASTPVDQDADGNRIDRTVYNVGQHNTPENTTVRLVGVSTDDPRNAKLVMQTWECEPTQTSLDRFTMSKELMKDLATFHQLPDETPLQALARIAKDLSANVTHIYGRRDMHIAYDLVWHSVLDFQFRGSLVGKGWLELLVIGDTRTGKSEAAERLRQHYQAGAMTSCEGATLAGIVGGAQTVGERWTITWGIIPLQDRRLVVLDEAGGLVGAQKNIIENMSEIRSSGRAKIVKIVAQETNARTRLIWICNPVDGRRINEMPRGAIDGIEGFISNPEDIARFDMATVAASEDVQSSVINAARQPKVNHVYTSDLCSQLVLWAWSRKSSQVTWERGAQRLCLVLAEKMGREYVPDPPLVQAENARVKLARVAVAIAARLFSHDDTGEKIVVTRAHVYAARAFLRRLYAAPSFGYEAHSAKELRARAVADEKRKECFVWLKRNVEARNALLAVINDTQFKVRDLEEFGGLSKDMAQLAIGDLMRMRMIRRMPRGYIRMEPELVGLLKRLES